jgi:methylase of polypeptide subunit release factors
MTSLGAALRHAGLTPRALAAWAGTDRLSALPARLDQLAARAVTPASAALALFVAGARVARPRLLDEVWPELVARGWIVDDHATVAILPVGRSLMVCDRSGWPDDSSYHLVGALAGIHADRWLDLGCGAGFAPLSRPELARSITGLELDDAAVGHARASCELSGIDHVTVRAGDVASIDTGTFDLITCNAPIPGDPDPSLWRRADPGLFDRLWRTARARAAPGATIVVHAAADELAIPGEGERVVCIYTPHDVRAFGVLWWRPDAPARLVTIHRALTIDRPHVDAADRG